MADDFIADSRTVRSVQKEKSFFGSMMANPWKPATFVLIVVIVVLALTGGLGGITGNAVSESAAADNLVSFIKGQGADASLVSVDKESGMYKVTVDIDGQKAPIYVSIDGKYAIAQPIPLTGKAVANSGSGAARAPAEVPKSDKPKVELFVMSYCPYGTQMEKGFLPVLALLGNKIDASIKFTHFTLHGEKEDTENYRQMCIREEQGSKFNAYLQCILDSSNVNAPADVNACMQKLGIDSAKVQNCIKTKADDYYKTDSELSEGYGVQGSPTLVINGVQASSGRSPAAILGAICSAFNTAPSECSQKLATDSPSAGFGYNAGGADAAAANCGV